MKIHDEDEENADYGRVRMYQALKYRKEVGKLDGIKIPCEATVRSVMKQINLLHRPKRKPNGITKADREARKSNDLLKRDFTADAPLKKCVTDITEIKAKDGKLYVSAIFDCYDLLPVGLAMADHMRAELCCETLNHANLRFPEIRGAIVHSDRGSQYTSAAYRAAMQKYGIVQSMNSAGGRCHDNARCESIWARTSTSLTSWSFLSCWKIWFLISELPWKAIVILENPLDSVSPTVRLSMLNPRLVNIPDTLERTPEMFDTRTEITY